MEHSTRRLNIKEIEDRVSNATAGPWAVDSNTKCIREGGDPSVSFRKQIHLEFWKNPSEPNSIHNQDNDLNFIAHAREDIPALLACVRDLAKELREMANKSYFNARNEADEILQKWGLLE